MAQQRRLAWPTTQSIASYVKKNAGRVRGSQARHHGTTESLRTAEHRGHKIVVKTRYDITIDGRRVTGHMGVSNDGHVHYHPIPNLSFASALDMVKAIIDVFPQRFESKARGAGRGRRRRRPRPHH
jgi:hypothetical protein